MKDKVRILFSDQKNKHGNDRWKEDKSEPLINLGFCHTGSSEHRRKDNSFNRTLMVEEDDHHDVYDQLVEKEGCRKCSVVRFTEEQLEELNRQLLILLFKYLMFLFIFLYLFGESFLTPLFLNTHNLLLFDLAFLSLVRKGIAVQALNGRRFHYQRAMETDLQSGRCRRTDGKKWRCQQVVIPNEKYCEKHMHRGSKRSRKLVEASPNAGTPNGIRLNPNRNINSGSSKAQFLVNVDQNGSSMVMMRTPSLNNTTANSDRNKNQHNETKSSIVSSPRSSVTNPASGFDFSPKSVLPNGMICARIEACKNTESEPRCKRTDGKKWRCKKGVVPYQKYCEQHINRGKVRSGKPPYLGSSACRESRSAQGSTSAAKSFETKVKEQIKVGLDTSLKISLPTTPAVDNGSSFSSEATVSDDENTGVWEIIALSP